MSSGIPDGALAVRTRDLTVTYGATVALERVDLDLPAGRIVSVIGPNGSGKSTLLDALAGLVEPTRGTVEVLGQPPGRAPDRVAYVLQLLDANEVVPLTVRELVTMGRYGQRGAFRRLSETDRQHVETSLRRLGVADLAGRQLTELSGGQRQRVLVAQGLAQQADLLLLDEPRTGLDLPTSRRIAGILAEERAAGRTIVTTTHDLAEAAAADHVVLLATAPVACGPPSEVLSADLLARAYGPHVHEMDDGTVVISDPHHHYDPERA